MIKTTIATAAMLAAILGAPAALAQSHSVPNMANPPQGQSDSKPATEATPGRTATADRQDARHPDKGQRDARANKAKGAGKGKAETKGEAAGGVKAQVKPDPDISKSPAGNETKEAMQVDPSEAQMNDVERHALDHSAGAKK